MNKRMSALNKLIDEFEDNLRANGYKYLGWQLGLYNEDFKKCYELGHMGGKPVGKRNEPTLVCSRSFGDRGSHDVNWCAECMIWWNIDMSD